MITEAVGTDAGMVPIDSIKVGDNRRTLDGAKVRDLADSISRLGLLNPITLLRTGNLVAGLHRIEACRLLGWTEIPAVVVELDCLHAELAQIDENLERNDLTVLERGQHLVRRGEILSANGFRAKVGDNQHVQGGGGDTMSPPHTTADLARQAGVSERTAQRSMSLARGIPSEVQRFIQSTPVANSTKELEALARLKPGSQRVVAEKLAFGDARTVSEGRRQHRFERLKAEAESFRQSNDAGDDQGILIGDMGILWQRLEDDSVPLFFTDPPYVEDSIHEYGRLAELAAVKLRPGGWCAAYVGTRYLDKVMAAMCDHLEFWWLFGVRLAPNPSMYCRRVQVSFRPVLVFYKPPAQLPERWMVDLKDGDNQDKRFHEWGQGERAPAYWIDRLTKPGDLVVDPYCGGGMTPAACKRTGRRWLATEIDPGTAAVARKRLADTNEKQNPAPA